jgi:taurine dioxygenase
MLKSALDVCAMPIGAEVAGFRRGDESDPAVCAALYDAWVQHGVLLFKDVDSTEYHVALSRCFGELAIHPHIESRVQDNPLLIEIGGARRGRAYVFDEVDVRVNRIAWHRDTAYTPDVCKGAMFRMLEAPTVEGETMFADTASAYDDLPSDVKRRLEGLEYKATLRLEPIQVQSRPGAFWKTARLATLEEDPDACPGKEAGSPIIARYPSVVQPAVFVHSESRRKCIFLSPTYVDYFIGMGQSESDELLNYLVRHMLNPQYIYKHRWCVNDAVLWDNQRFMHAGMGSRIDEPRRGLRTTLANPLRTGRYFDEDVAMKGSMLVD